MSLSSYFKHKQKTSAEIISEAKASVSSLRRREPQGEPMRPLSTKRPFTPRQKDRYSSYDMAFRRREDSSRPLSGIKLEPLAETPGRGLRAQFRLQRVKEEDSINSVVREALESPQGIVRLTKRIEGETLGEKDLKSLLRLLEGFPGVLASALASLLPQVKAKVSLRLPVFMAIFGLAKDDSHDELFLREEDFLPRFLTALALGDPTGQPEDLIYAYGSLKFLSMNSAILGVLEEHGFLDLLLLHIKLLSKHLAESSTTHHLLFQMTASLRNALNTQVGRKKLLDVKALGDLTHVFNFCMEDPDVICNLSRILSVMSADEEAAQAFLGDISLLEPALQALFKYSDRSEVVVRLAYSLGNLLGQYDEIRKYIYDKRFEEGQSDLFERLSQLLTLYSSNGSKYDVAIKIIRIFANASINPEAGSEMALCPVLVESVLNLLDIEDGDSVLDLQISCVSTLNNLSFYPIFSHQKVYERLIPMYTFHNNSVLATESMRVLGNLSRKAEIRSRLVEEGVFVGLIARIPSQNKDYDYSTYGVMVNMMVDAVHRPLFRENQGFQKSLDILEEGIRQEDYDLCTLVCQALWNYSIDLHKSHVNPEEIADLNDILSVVIYQKQEESNAEHENDEFCDLYSMSQGLLIRYNKIISVENGYETNEVSSQS